ncbi:TPA: hypothetical protein ACRZZI_004932 [Vibrio harveyi]
MIAHALADLTQSGFSVLDNKDISNVEQTLFDDKGRLKPVPADVLQQIDNNELRVFCHAHGIYSVPSVELISFLDKLIPDKSKALEIGAGNGVYGRALGVKMTDNFMQDIKNARKFKGVFEAYAVAQQPVVQYGDDVIEIDGKEAVVRFKPETILMSWVTHKWNQRESHRGGNMYGVDFESIIKRKFVKRVILIGNKHVHAKSPLMDYPHEEKHLPEILFSRSTHQYLDRVFIWNFNNG